MLTSTSRVAAVVLAFLFLVAFSASPASAIPDPGGLIGGVGGAVNGAAGAIGGAVNNVAGGTLGGAAGSGGAGGLGGQLFGPSDTLSSLLSSPMGSEQLFSDPAMLDNLAWQLHLPAKAAAAVLLELKQRNEGKLLSVSGDVITIATPDGSKKLIASDEVAAALRAFVGKQVILRSADGVHVTSVVGQHDAIRGLVTAVSDNLVTFISSNGEIHTIKLVPGAIGKLGVRVGASVVALSNDFDKSASFGVLNVAPSSLLNDAYVGTVRRVTNNIATIALGGALQSFIVDAPIARILNALLGKTVVLAIPDGVHVKTLISSPMVDEVIAIASGQVRANGGILAQVIATSKNRLTLQLPDGDVVSYLLTTPLLNSRTRVAAMLTPLDFLHARIKIGAKVFNAIDAGACVTLNASCKAQPIGGTVVAIDPASIAVRLANGDLRTLLGDVRGLDANVGVPVTITPLDHLRARITAGLKVANLVDARACVTINAGCHDMPGTVLSSSANGLLVGLADGTKIDLRGSTNGLGLAENLPIIVQPLDDIHAIVQAGANVANLVNLDACVTVNAMCVASTGGLGGPISANAVSGATATALGNSASANACATLNAPGCGHGSNGDGTVVDANGCVSVNGGACTASTGGGGNGGGGNGGGGSGNGGGSNAGGGGNGGGGNAGGGNGGGGNAGSGNAGGGNAGGGNGGGSGSGPNKPAVLQPLQVAYSVISAAATSVANCSDDGQVVVNVTDIKTNKAIVGASVKLSGAVNTQWVTGKTGSIRFLRLPTGNYTVAVQRPGYKSIQSAEVHVDCLEALRVSVRMAAVSTKKTAQPKSAVYVTRSPRVTVAALITTKNATCVTKTTTKGRRAYCTP